jgi:hypothetical protein
VTLHSFAMRLRVRPAASPHCSACSAYLERADAMICFFASCESDEPAFTSGRTAKTMETVAAWKSMNGKQGGDPVKLAGALVKCAAADERKPGRQSLGRSRLSATVRQLKGSPGWRGGQLA